MYVYIIQNKQEASHYASLPLLWPSTPLTRTYHLLAMCAAMSSIASQTAQMDLYIHMGVSICFCVLNPTPHRASHARDITSNKPSPRTPARSYASTMARTCLGSREEASLLAATSARYARMPVASGSCPGSRGTASCLPFTVAIEGLRFRV